MKRLVTFALFLTCCLVSAENPIISTLEKGNSGKEVILTFSDGYTQSLGNNFSVSSCTRDEVDCSSLRVMSKSHAYYKLTYNEGAKKEERILFHHIGLSPSSDPTQLSWIGSDGATYDVSSISDQATGKILAKVRPIEGREDSGEPCILLGDYSQTTIATRKLVRDKPIPGLEQGEIQQKYCSVSNTVECIGDDIIECSAQVFCKSHASFTGQTTVKCLAQDGVCPSPTDCFDDLTIQEQKFYWEDHGYELRTQETKTIQQ